MKEIGKNELQGQEMPSDGWYIIEAAGEHRAIYEGKPIIENLTPEVLGAIAAAGVPEEGLFIDRDHFSLDEDKGTEALGWVRELAVCEGNLAGRIEWTPLGLPLIQGKIYKHFSTVYEPTSRMPAGGKFTPTHLIGLALTNQPNNKTGQPPITNREPATIQKENNTMDYPAEMLAKLGLAEGAGDEEVIGAIDALNKRVADAESASAAAAEAEAEAIVNGEEKEAGAVLNDEEKQECKEQIVANRAHGMRFTKLLCNSKRTAPGVPVVNARRYGDESKPAVANRKQNAETVIANRARQLCDEARKTGQKLDYWTALARARREEESLIK